MANTETQEELCVLSVLTVLYDDSQWIAVDGETGYPNANPW